MNKEDLFNEWIYKSGFYKDGDFYKKEYKGTIFKRQELIDMYKSEALNMHVVGVSETELVCLSCGGAGEQDYDADGRLEPCLECFK